MPVEKISSLKKELNSLSQKELMEICLKTARLKTENKEFITYMVYYKDDPLQYGNYIKEEMGMLFSEFNDGPHAYKTLRKAMRMITKYKRFTASKHGTADLYVYFIEKIIASRNTKYSRTTHILLRAMDQLAALIPLFEEDLKFDYSNEYQRFTEKINKSGKESKLKFPFKIF